MPHPLCRDHTWSSQWLWRGWQTTLSLPHRARLQFKTAFIRLSLERMNGVQELWIRKFLSSATDQRSQIRTTEYPEFEGTQKGYWVQPLWQTKMCKTDCTWAALHTPKPSSASTTPGDDTDRFWSFIPYIYSESTADWQGPAQWTCRKARGGMGWAQGSAFPSDSRKQHTAAMLHKSFCFTSQIQATVAAPGLTTARASWNTNSAKTQTLWGLSPEKRLLKKIWR